MPHVTCTENIAHYVNNSRNIAQYACNVNMFTVVFTVCKRYVNRDIAEL